MIDTVDNCNDEQFLWLWSEIIHRGGKATSLKFALAYALLELADENTPTGEILRVSKQELTQRFVNYYWLQATQYHLRQARNSKMEPSFSFLLEGAANKDDPAIEYLQQLSQDTLHSLEQNGFKELLPRFHNLPGGNTSASRCKFYTVKGGSIVVSAQAHDFLARHAQLLRPDVVLQWTYWLEQCNPDTPGIASMLTHSLTLYPSRTALPPAREEAPGTPELSNLIHMLTSLADEQT